MALIVAWLISSVVGFLASAVDTYDVWVDWSNQRHDPLYKRGDLVDRTARVRLQSRGVLLVLTGSWVLFGILALLLHDGHTGEIILWGLVAGNILVAGEGAWFKLSRLRRARVVRRSLTPR